MAIMTKAGMEDQKFGIATKTYMLKELLGKFESSPDFIIINYKGLKSGEIEKLRKDLRGSSSGYFVVKNSIAKRAFEQMKMKDMLQFIKEEVGIGFAGDVMEASKTFVNFSKKHDSFKLCSAVIDGKIEGLDRIRQMALLPSREVMLGLVLSHMMAPITGFTQVLKNLLRNLVYAISEIKKGKEGGKKQ